MKKINIEKRKQDVKKLQKELEQKKKEVEKLRKKYNRKRNIQKLIILYPEEAHRLATLASLWRKSQTQVIRDLINEKFLKNE